MAITAAIVGRKDPRAKTFRFHGFTLTYTINITAVI
jgi:hypothetical protein